MDEVATGSGTTGTDVSTPDLALLTVQTLPARVSERAQALALLAAIGAGVEEAELARFVRAMVDHDHAQVFAIMRGSGNEMSLRLQLGTLLAEAGLVDNDEVFAAMNARRALGDAA